MIPWVKIDTAQIPGSNGELRLMRRGAEFSIKLGANELMNSRLRRVLPRERSSSCAILKQGAPASVSTAAAPMREVALAGMLASSRDGNNR